MKDLIEFILENKKKVFIIVVVIIVLIIIGNLFDKKEVVENSSTTSPKTGWNAEHNPEFDDPNAENYEMDSQLFEEMGEEMN